MPTWEDTLAPPGEYNWTCASFGPPESTTQTAYRSVQLFLHSSRQKVSILYNGRPFPRKLPLLMGDLDLIWFVIPWTHPSQQSNGISIALAFLVQMTTECPSTLQWDVPNSPPPQNCPLPWGIWTPCNTWFPGPTQVLHINGISIASAVFAELTSVTDQPTDHATRSVTIDRIVRSTGDAV